MLNFFKSADEKHYVKARRRLDSVTETQARQWAETSLWAVQEGLESNDLEQARTGIVGVLAAIDSVLDRSA